MAKREKLVGVGLGAGLLGALLLALRYAVRPPTKERVPDTISPAIFATKVLHTSLGQMVYHESGSGQPLIFIHSIWPGGSSYEWSKVYPEFAARYRVLAPDLIGFGESARPDLRMRANDQARTLAEFIRATCDQPPILVGSGLGAGFCVLAASQHPELVARLLLLMPSGLAEFGQRRLPLTAKLASRTPILSRFLYRNYRSTRAAIRHLLATNGFMDATKLTEEMVEVFTTCARQYGAEHGILNFHSGRFSFDLENRLRSLLHPVTFLWSPAVAYPPLEWGYRFQATMKSSSLAILPELGALAALEDPAAVAAILREELQDELRVFRAL
jgi:pimeloyl-ACP methyl ester carboxylesterase